MIPKQWSDQTLAAITYLRTCTSLAGVTITRSKQPGKTKQIVLDSEPQQLETPLSRRVTLLLEAWAVRANGDPYPAESYRLMDVALYELQKAPQHLKPVVMFDSPIGPRIEKDDAGIEYHEGSLVWVVSS